MASGYLDPGTMVLWSDGKWHRAGDLANFFGWGKDSSGDVLVEGNITVQLPGGNTTSVSNLVAAEPFRRATSDPGTDADQPTGGTGGEGSDEMPQDVGTGSGATAEDPGKATADKNALAMLESVLADYGFSAAEVKSLAGWAWGLITGGAGQAEILLQMRQRPEFKAKFPEIEARQKAGLAPIGPGEIVEYRRRARQMFAQFGLPQGFYDQDRDFADFLTKDISLSELQERVEQGYARAVQAPAEVRAELKRFFGIGEGQLAAYYLDENRALPLLMRQHRMAEIGGASKRTGFGALSRSEADELAGRDITGQQAEAGFGALAESRELFNPLVGQEESEERIGRQTQLGAAFRGDANARRKIERQARRRTAAFESGGGFGASREGISGLGRAD